MDTLFKEPIWSLARGDVFQGKFIPGILLSLKILPVYRTSEGVENLTGNYKTFESCIELFRKNAVVMIFSEGKSINEWRLRPLKKGTARLAMKAWAEGIPLRVLPVGINYSSFQRFGKNVFINFGETINQEDIPQGVTDGFQYQAFNQLLQQQLEQLVFEIPGDNIVQQSNRLEKKPGIFKIVLLAIPAIPGYLLHAPLYLPIRYIARKKLSETDHFDSVVVGSLFFLYPLYVLIASLLVFFLTSSWLSFMLLLVFPFTAWSYVQVKEQLDK